MGSDNAQEMILDLPQTQHCMTQEISIPITHREETQSLPSNFFFIYHSHSTVRVSLATQAAVHPRFQNSFLTKAACSVN